MSKKNRADYWGNVDSEKAADDFFKFEKDGTPIPVDYKKKNGIDELHELIGRDLDGRKDRDEENTSEDYSYDGYTNYIPVDIDETKIRSISGSLAPIRVSICHGLRRILIDDRIAPVCFSYDEDCILDTFVDYPGYNDPDETATMVSRMIERIIATRYPSAIFTHEEFESAFKNVKGYSFVHFAFYKTDKYVFAYIVDEESFSDLNKLVEENCEEVSDMLDFFVSVVHFASSKHNSFPYYDKKHVEMYRKYIEDHTAYNELFIQEFITDSQTYTNEDDPSDFDYLIGFLEIEDLNDLIEDTDKIIEMLVDDEDDDDEADESNIAAMEEIIQAAKDVLKDAPAYDFEKSPISKPIGIAEPKERIQIDIPIDPVEAKEENKEVTEAVKSDDKKDELVADLDENMEIEVGDDPEPEKEKEPETKTIKPVDINKVDESMVIPVVRKHKS